VDLSPDVSLRAYTSGDLVLLRGLLGDEEAMLHLGGALSEGDIAARHERYLDPAVGDHLFVIEHRGESVGWIGLWDGEEDDTCEAGWHMLRQSQGRRFASAALQSLLDVAARLERLRYVDAHPSVANEASNALCRAAGFKALGEVMVEFPKGRPMRSMHWRYDLAARRRGPHASA
jgi:RimJ/RimL family protein N-acetyltransferase